MQALRLGVAIDEVAQRMMTGLQGPARPEARQVVWYREGHRVLLHTHTFKARALDGWLVCNLDAECDETGRQTLQFVWFLGREADAGPHGALAVNAVTPGSARIADRWGKDLGRVLWDGILDTVEVCMDSVTVGRHGQPVALAGFFSTRDRLMVDVALVGT